MRDSPFSGPALPTAEATLSGWGRYPRVKSWCLRAETRSDLRRALASTGANGIIPRGMGRAYGDAALLRDGLVLLTGRLDRMLGFDPETGWMRCEAGVTIDDIIRVFLPRGFFPPVVPGTKFVTVGGALASDIHGKNHHRAGSWADHVRRVEILKANGEIVECDHEHSPGLFWATVGGMGLTGVILSMEVQLISAPGAAVRMEAIRVRNLDEFFEVSEASSDFTYSVGWFDGLARGESLGRGIFMRGEHAPSGGRRQSAGASAPTQRGDPPGRPRNGSGLMSLTPSGLLNGKLLESNLLLNRATVKLFNAAYYRRSIRRHSRRTVSTDAFFFPLDAVRNWNYLYGKRGFLQYQFAVPTAPDRRAVREPLEMVARAGLPSFLGVIKEFGPTCRWGLSFPMPGVTVALDFPNVGPRLHELLDRLDGLVAEAGGRVYLTKDARLGVERFRQMYPDWERWKAVRDSVDPDGVFASELGRRLGLVTGAEDGGK